MNTYLNIEEVGTDRFVTLVVDEQSEIDAIGYGMLKNNKIPGIVNFDKVVTNGIEKMRYDVTNFISVGEFIKNEITSIEIAKILKSAIEVLIGADDYLLDTFRFMFSPYNVYVNLVDKSVGLLYVPISQYRENSNDVFTLTKYIINNGQFKVNEASSCISSLLSYINAPGSKTNMAFLNVLDNIVSGSPVQVKEIPVLKTFSSAHLVRKKNNEKIEVTLDEFKIGYDVNKVDYCCKDNNAISRVHAIITKENGQYYITDNKSSNKTYLENKVIKSKEKMILRNGIVITLANENFIFYCN